MKYHGTDGNDETLKINGYNPSNGFFAEHTGPSFHAMKFQTEALPSNQLSYAPTLLVSLEYHATSLPVSILLRHLGHPLALRQEPLDERRLYFSALVALVSVVHRRVYMRLSQHPLHHQWAVSLLNQGRG